MFKSEVAGPRGTRLGLVNHPHARVIHLPLSDRGSAASAIAVPSVPRACLPNDLFTYPTPSGLGEAPGLPLTLRVQGVWGPGGCWGLTPAGRVMNYISDELLEISVAFTLSHS